MQCDSLRSQRENEVEMERYLIEIEGLWCDNTNLALISKNSNFGGNFTSNTKPVRSQGMQKLLSNKFRKPTTSHVPRHPEERRREQEEKLTNRSRPLQPGDLDRRYHGNAQQYENNNNNVQNQHRSDYMNRSNAIQHPTASSSSSMTMAGYRMEQQYGGYDLQQQQQQQQQQQEHVELHHSNHSTTRKHDSKSIYYFDHNHSEESSLPTSKRQQLETSSSNQWNQQHHLGLRNQDNPRRNDANSSVQFNGVASSDHKSNNHHLQNTNHLAPSAAAAAAATTVRQNHANNMHNHKNNDDDLCGDASDFDARDYYEYGGESKSFSEEEEDGVTLQAELAKRRREVAHRKLQSDSQQQQQQQQRSYPEPRILSQQKTSAVCTSSLDRFRAVAATSGTNIPVYTAGNTSCPAEEDPSSSSSRQGANGEEMSKHATRETEKVVERRNGTEVVSKDYLLQLFSGADSANVGSAEGEATAPRRNEPQNPLAAKKKKVEEKMNHRHPNIIGGGSSESSKGLHLLSSSGDNFWGGMFDEEEEEEGNVGVVLSREIADGKHGNGSSVHTNNRPVASSGYSLKEENGRNLVESGQIGLTLPSASSSSSDDDDDDDSSSSGSDDEDND